MRLVLRVTAKLHLCTSIAVSHVQQAERVPYSSMEVCLCVCVSIRDCNEFDEFSCSGALCAKANESKMRYKTVFNKQQQQHLTVYTHVYISPRGVVSVAIAMESKRLSPTGWVTEQILRTRCFFREHGISRQISLDCNRHIKHRWMIIYCWFCEQMKTFRFAEHVCASVSFGISFWNAFRYIWTVTLCSFWSTTVLNVCEIFWDRLF